MGLRSLARVVRYDTPARQLFENPDLATDMGEHRRRPPLPFLLRSVPGKLAPRPDLGPELDEGFGRRQPLELHPSWA